MKKQILISIFFLITIISHAQNKYDLIGYWQVDLNKTVQGLNNHDRIKYDSVSVQGKENIRQVFENRTFYFSEENELHTIYLDRDTSNTNKGKWEIDTSNESVSISMDGETNQYQIVWYTPNQFQLIQTNASAQALLKSTYFKRVNYK